MKAMCISNIVLIIIGFAVFSSYSSQWEVLTNKNHVQDIVLSGNTLWAATDGGVVTWNLVDNSYTSYTTADGLLSCNINQIAIDKKGRLWAATKNPAGLFVFENHIWKQINVGGIENELGYYTIISGLEVDQFGNVWVYVRPEWGGWYKEEVDTHYYLTNSYLWRYDGQTWHINEGVCGPLALDKQKNLLAVDSLFITGSDHMSTYKSLQFRIVSYNGSEFVSKWRSNIVNSMGCARPSLALIALDSKDNPWVVYLDEVLPRTNGVVCNNTIYNTQNGLAADNVRSITPDDSGVVWCATGGGISKFTGTSWVTYDTTKGVASNIIYMILIGSDNALYVATSKGISIMRSDQWKTLKTNDELLHNNYGDIVIDKRGAVILSGGDNILIYNDLKWRLNYVREPYVKELY